MPHLGLALQTAPSIILQYTAPAILAACPNPTTARNLASVQMRPEYWAPSKRAQSAGDMLQAQRLRIAGDVAAEFTFAMPKGQRRWDAAQMNYATLFLIDSLACALAFDASELMDSQRQWLAEEMPPRSVMPAVIDMHLRFFERVLSKPVAKGQMRLFEPLVEHVRNTSHGFARGLL